MSAKDKAQRDMDDTIARFGDGHETLGNALISAHAYAAAAVAEAVAPLMEALQLVEWIDCVVGDGEDEDSWRECAYCRNQREQGHHRDCPIAAALAKETP